MGLLLCLWTYFAEGASCFLLDRLLKHCIISLTPSGGFLHPMVSFDPRTHQRTFHAPEFIPAGNFLPAPFSIPSDSEGGSFGALGCGTVQSIRRCLLSVWLLAGSGLGFWLGFRGEVGVRSWIFRIGIGRDWTWIGGALGLLKYLDMGWNYWENMR